MFATFFTDTPIRDWTTVKTCDTERFGRYFSAMLENGVYLAPRHDNNERYPQLTLNKTQAPV